MDDAWFDTLSRLLGQGTSRRGVLGVLAAFLVAPVAAAPQSESCLTPGKPCAAPKDKRALRVQGKRHRGHHLRSCTKCCSRNSTVGKDGKARCTCIFDGHPCTNPSDCCSGNCRSGRCAICPVNQVICKPNDVECVDMQTDDRYCGSCQNACDAGQHCQSGQCV
jgi:hypothetical protein